MGYKTEINYILKASSKEEGDDMRAHLSKGQPFKVSKMGSRTYVINSPIMFADENWKILGMCGVLESKVTGTHTEAMAVVLTVFTPEESEITSRLIQEAEAVIGHRN